MMPASSSSPAASLLNSACSPAKNFWFAARSCQRRFFWLASNLLGRLLDVRAHDLEGLLRFGLDHRQRIEVAVGQCACAAFGLSARNFGVQPKVSMIIG